MVSKRYQYIINYIFFLFVRSFNGVISVAIFFNLKTLVFGCCNMNRYIMDVAKCKSIQLVCNLLKIIVNSSSNVERVDESLSNLAKMLQIAIGNHLKIIQKMAFMKIIINNNCITLGVSN